MVMLIKAKRDGSAWRERMKISEGITQESVQLSTEIRYSDMNEVSV